MEDKYELPNKENLPRVGYGLKSPQDTELEKTLLVGCISSPEYSILMVTMLEEDDFYKPEHRIIYRAIRSLIDNGMVADLISVNSKLNDSGEDWGGISYLMGGSYFPSDRLETYCKIIKDKSLKRQYIRSYSVGISKCFEDELLADEISNTIISETNKNLNEKKQATNEEDSTQIYKEAIGEVQAGIEFTPFKSFNDKVRCRKGDLVVIAGRPSMGKCFRADTRIIMFDGTYKKVQDIRVGDQVMGDDNTPRNVLSTTSGTDQMYRISQSFGCDYVVNSNHILSLQNTDNKKIIDISVSDWFKKSNKFKIRHKGYKLGYELKEQAVAIEPYFLGLWLADGSKNSVDITNPDKEIYTYLEGYAERLGLSLKDYTPKLDCPTLAITGIRGGGKSLLSKMRAINVINNKHIPINYLLNSKHNRLQLLAGLIDGDGYNNGNCCYEITQKRKDLAFQIKRLADSLGFRTKIVEKKATIKSLGFSCMVWRLRISGNVSTIPCKVDRKKSREWTSHRGWNRSGIKISEEGIGQYYGFMTDGNHRFLIEDGTVTHNSMMATTVLNQFINQDMKGVFWGLEMMNKDNKKRLLCCRYSINFKQMMKGELKPSKDLDDALDSMLQVTKDKVTFIDQTGVNALAIKSRLMMLKAEMGIEFAIIDYGGLMAHNLGNKNLTKSDQIGETTKAMKEIAKDLDIVLIFLWQVGRPQKGQAIRPPSLSDLKHSGSLEEDADIVVFIHREAYYEDINKEDTNPKTLLKTAKHRNGEVGIEYCNSDFQYARFVDIDNSDIVWNGNKKENNQIKVPF